MELLWELGVELHRQHTGKIAIMSGRERVRKRVGVSCPVFPGFAKVETKDRSNANQALDRLVRSSREGDENPRRNEKGKQTIRI